MRREETTGSVTVTELMYSWRCDALRLRPDTSHLESVLTQLFLINASEVIKVSC